MNVRSKNFTDATLRLDVNVCQKVLPHDTHFRIIKRNCHSILDFYAKKKSVK